MRYVPLLIILILSLMATASPQDVLTIDGQPCGMQGSAHTQQAKSLNLLKNRYTAPSPADFDHNVTLQAILAPGDDTRRFDDSKSAEISGYAFNVKEGGVESCNCGAKDPLYRDTHIEMTLNERDTLPGQRVIVEITPRFRQIMAKQGTDYSTSNLHRTIKGKWIEVTGWLLFDSEHLHEAENTDPGNTGRKNWRATCWEIHPITSLEILSGPPAAQAPSATSAQSPEKQTEQTAAHKRLHIIIVLLSIALVLAGQIVRVIQLVMQTARRTGGRRMLTPADIAVRTILAVVLGAIAGVAFILIAPNGNISFVYATTLVLAGYIVPDLVVGRRRD